MIRTYVPRVLLDRALWQAGRRSLLDRLHALRALAETRGLRYVDDAGRARTIEIAAKPWLLTSAQLLAFHRTISLLADALRRVSLLQRSVPAVRAVVHFDPVRDAWLALASQSRARPLAVLGRLDSTAIFDHARWASDFRMLEPNAVGVGGVHYAPAACSVALDVVGDLLTRALPGRVITPTPDPRQLLIDELRAVARRAGRLLRGVALIENADYTTGTDEFSALAQFLTRRGLRVVVADPREVRVVRGDIRARGMSVDLLYRDSELSELVEIEAAGCRLTGVREAVRQGRLISSLAWEIDQKAAWEIFTDARYERYFTPAQRRMFRVHLLWTRLLRAATVTDPAGRRVDLIDFTRRNRERLVLKPNALFGGEGVVLGPHVDQRQWERTIRQALRGSERYVVQQLAVIPTDRFPVLADHHVRQEPRSVVSGFFFTSSGIGVVGRFSSRPVVNVSQGGGLIPALWVH